MVCICIDFSQLMFLPTVITVVCDVLWLIIEIKAFFYYFFKIYFLHKEHQNIIVKVVLHIK